MERNYIYWIRHKSHTDIKSQGYVGVSNNVKERIRHHFKNAKGNYHTDKLLNKALNKYEKNQLIHEVVLIGDKNYCYQIEKKLRPKSFIGWNMREGGYHTPNPFPKGSKMPEWVVQKAQNALKELRKIKSVGRDRQVLVNGVIYNSVKSAREANNISSSQMKRLLSGTKKGWKFGHLEVKYAN